MLWQFVEKQVAVNGLFTSWSRSIDLSGIFNAYFINTSLTRLNKTLRYIKERFQTL